MGDRTYRFAGVQDGGGESCQKSLRSLCEYAKEPFNARRMPESLIDKVNNFTCSANILVIEYCEIIFLLDASQVQYIIQYLSA